MTGGSTHSYRFKSFRLDLEERQLLHNESPVSLTPKAFDVLATLVERAGHLVEKDELLKTVWADSFVEEANVARIVHTLRRVLGEDQNGNKFIETVAKSGYRFVAEIEVVQEPKARVLEPGQPTYPADDVLSDAIILDEPAEIDQLIPLADTMPAAPKSQMRIVLFGVGFLTAVSLILLLSFDFRSGSSTGTSFAVLPLKPINSATRDEIYEIGIAESLINKLSSAKTLVVRPLSATRKYADIEQDAIAAGREQQVDFVLASNYQIADGKIRITSQLINVQSGLVEEVFKYEQDNSSIFAVQDAVAANIGGPLLTKLNRQSNDLSEKRYTINEEAYRLYIQGTVLGKRTNPDVRKAIEYFEKAVQLDPNFALAYAELASAHSFALNSGGRKATEGYIKAKAAIEKALAIDDNLAEAHSYLGVIKTNYEWDFAGAELEHQRAVELNPNSAAAHRMYAGLLVILGRFDESFAEMKTAIDLEPASAGNHHVYGWLLFQARRYDEAITEEQRAVEMDPKIVMAYNVLANSYGFKGDDDKSFEAFVQMKILRGEEPDEINSLKTIYARSGWRGVSERQLEEAKAAEKKGNPNYANLAGQSIELGQYEQALTYLEKAVDQNRFTLITLKVNPRYDPLRSDPRFDDLLKRVGLE